MKISARKKNKIITFINFYMFYNIKGLYIISININERRDWFGKTRDRVISSWINKLFIK